MNLRIALWATFAAVVALPVPGVRAALIYDFVNYPADQNGHALTGTITTADTAPDDGVLMAAEILAWEFEVTGPDALSGSSSDAGASQIVFGATITPTEIVFPFPPPTSSEIYEFRFRGSDGELGYLRAYEPVGIGVFSWYRAIHSHPGPEAWFTYEPLMGEPVFEGLSSFPWIVATRVPEPAGAMLLCSLAGAGLILGRRRRAR